MSNLSDTFKYISHFRHAGHQVGRKVGDMLELLTYAAIANDQSILSRLHVEPKLFGFSDAGHKVEFVILDEESEVKNAGEITDPSNVISFIECKKVGVEQTINSGFKKNKSFKKHKTLKAYHIPLNEEFKISFSPRGDAKHTFILTFNNSKQLVITKKEDSTFNVIEDIQDAHRVIFALSDNNEITVLTNDKSLRDFTPTLKSCRILEILSIDDESAVALLNDCLAGPQTPEKAKQSSFVALDVRKKRFGSFDKRIPENEMSSILVLTEFAHWEQKSQNMISACIDRNLVVDDSLIIEAFRLFEEEFGESFYDMITKDNFEKNTRVSSITKNLVRSYENKIFKDIDDGIYKKMAIVDGSLILTS